MREVPRQIPFRYKFLVLTSSLYFLVGTTFLVASASVIYILNIDFRNWQLSTWIGVFMIWGLGLMVYTILINYKKLRLLIWGKISFGKLLSREKSYSDFIGRMSFQCEFEYAHQLRNYQTVVSVLEAYHMDEEKFFLLLINEDHPEKMITIEQFSKSLKAYFFREYRSNITQAIRAQNVEVDESFWPLINS